MLNAQQAYEMVKKEIEKIIIDEYEKKKTPTKEIANILNIIGYKTITGKQFTDANISYYAMVLGLTKRKNKKLKNFNNNEKEISDIIIKMYNSGIKLDYITKELNKKGYKSKILYKVREKK